MAEILEGRPAAPVTDMHKALAAFEGTWDISQRFFTAPGSKPILVKGKTTCKVLLNGLAVYMESELENGYKSIVLTTWNPSTGQYEGVFMDLHSFDGFDPMTGAAAADFPAPTGGALNLADAAAAKPGTPVLKRTWNSRITVPRTAALVPGTAGILAGVDAIPVQIAEHQVSANQWALLCVSASASGTRFAQMENTYTRAK